MLSLSVTVAEDSASHNPLLPETPDLVWGTLCFVLILFFFWKFALPRIQKVMDERAKLIEGGIEKASAAQAEAQQLLDQYKAQLAEARDEASNIRESARSEGQQILAELKASAQSEAERIVQSAQAQIAVDRQAAFTELKSEVGLLALDLASSIVGEALSDDARSKAVVDRFLTELDGAAK